MFVNSSNDWISLGMKNFFNYLLSWTSFNQNFAIFYALQQWVIQAKDMERSFETCVGVAGHRFRTGSPAVAIAWPVPIWSRNRCNHVSSSAQQTLVRRRAEGRRPRCVRGDPSACVPTSRISERYVVDLLPHELNPFRFRYRTPREIPLDVYSIPYLPHVRSCRAKSTCPFSSYLHNYVS